LHEAEASHYIFTWSKPHPPFVISALNFVCDLSFVILPRYHLIAAKVALRIAVCYHSYVERRMIFVSWLGMSIEG
jgi:hypothetical protein